MEHWISFLGIWILVLLGWLCSNHKRIIPWRVIFYGVGLQFLLAWSILKTGPGKVIFTAVGSFFTNILNYVDIGSRFVFGPNFTDHFFAFKVLPTIIFFSSFMAILYHVGIMQRFVKVTARLMQRLLKTSGAETLSAVANIFVGQTEAPLVVRPYIESMTQSELMVLMTGGFATVAGGVLAAYVGMGIDAGHLVTASVISAPATLVLAKIMIPETQVPKTRGDVSMTIESNSVNLIDAASAGAAEGLKLALNVGAMLIAFLALIALLDTGVAWVGGLFGFDWKLSQIFGYAFSPLAWIIGVENKDVLHVGELLGLKMVANEFIAYEKLGRWMQDPSLGVDLSERSKILSTYALCGFANFSSIGMQLGGISPLAPSRRHDLAKISLRAMWGGTLAALMTAAVAGVLL